ANITDDYGVQSAQVAWEFANGSSGTVELSPVGGNNWTAQVPRPPGSAAPIALTSATLAAADHAGHTATVAGGC
ncbi:MAG: hypothetical protein ACREN5_16430, partial [Gemmatimonadales bacterium]